MKFIAKLQKFKRFFGMSAQIKNSEGDILDSVDIAKTKNSKLKFEFDKAEALGEEKKAELAIVFTDTNGDEKNLQKSSKKTLFK